MDASQPGNLAPRARPGLKGRLHGKPSPLTHNLLALTYVALGQKDKANAARAQARPGKDAAWEDMMLQRVFEPELTAAFAPTAPGKVKVD